MPASDLQASIRSGELNLAGEKIRVVTADGAEHEFTVTRLDETTIHGAETSVQIDDVVAIQTRKISAGKTTLLVGSAVSIWILIAVLVAPAAILAAAAP